MSNRITEVYLSLNGMGIIIPIAQDMPGNQKLVIESKHIHHRYLRSLLGKGKLITNISVSNLVDFRLMPKKLEITLECGRGVSEKKIQPLIDKIQQAGFNTTKYRITRGILKGI